MRLGRDEADIGRDRHRNAVKLDPPLRAEPDHADLIGGQEDLHIDLAEIQQRQHLAPAGQNLARLGQPVQHPPLHRGGQPGVVDLRLIKLHQRAGGIGGAFLGVQRGDGGVQRGLRRFQLGIGAVDDLLRGDAAIGQLRGAVVFLLRQFTLGPALGDHRLGLTDAGIGAFDIRRGARQLGVQLARVHFRQKLPFADQIALLRHDPGDTPRRFGGDIDLLGLDPAIAGGKACRIAIAAIGKKRPADGTGGGKKNDDDDRATCNHDGACCANLHRCDDLALTRLVSP